MVAILVLSILNLEVSRSPFHETVTVKGEIQSVQPVISIAYHNVNIDEVDFETENEKFIFDNNYDNSFINNVDANGRTYNFPMSTYYSLDIYSVVQSLSNASSVLMSFSSDDNEVNFSHPEVFKGIYQDLTQYDEQFSCLEGLKLSDLKKIGKDSDSSTNEKESSENSKYNKSNNKNKSWPSSKNSELTSFMDLWSQEMDQSYSEMTFDESIATFGDHSVNDLIDGSIQPIVSGSPVKFSYDSFRNYHVVTVHDGATNDGTDTVYVFAISPGGPVTLVSQGNNSGNSVSFKPTANTTLQSGFANIANS